MEILKGFWRLVRAALALIGQAVGVIHGTASLVHIKKQQHEADVNKALATLGRLISRLDLAIGKILSAEAALSGQLPGSPEEELRFRKQLLSVRSQFQKVSGASGDLTAAWKAFQKGDFDAAREAACRGLTRLDEFVGC